MGNQHFKERMERNYSRRKARLARMVQVRKEAKKKYAVEIKSFMAKVKYLISGCGLTQTQISLFSGLAKSAVTRLAKKPNPTARINSIIQILGAAGYELKIVPKDPRKDEFREYRRFKLAPLED